MGEVKTPSETPDGRLTWLRNSAYTERLPDGSKEGLVDGSENSDDSKTSHNSTK
jgi:hypothetical protein